MTTVIKDPLKADEFFMENVWDMQDREDIQDLSSDLLDAYVQILSDCLKLSFRDMRHLAREMTYHTISAFIDTAYRLKQHPCKINRINVEEFQESLTIFFSEETVQSPLHNSRTLRCNLTNLMLKSLGASPIFADINQEPQRIRLEDLNLQIAKEEPYWKLHYNVTHRIPNGVWQYIKAYFNIFRQYFSNGLTRIGYINLDKKYMMQLPDIKFVPIGLNLDEFLGSVSIDERRKLHNKIKSSFISQARKINGWELCLGGTKVNDSFLELLLSFIILKGESLLCKPNKLHEAINFCERTIADQNLKSLFSEGGWFRFNNAIIAIAGRRLRLPIIEFQTGGAFIYKIEKGFDWRSEYHDKNLSVNHYLHWGVLGNKHLDDSRIYKKVANPHLSTMKNYTKKGNSEKLLKILYTPIGLSNLYSMENWTTISSYDMLQHRKWVEEIFCYLNSVINYKLYIKIKGFGYHLFKHHEWMLFPKIKIDNCEVVYLIEGQAKNKFNYIDLHLFCGPSTTFAESMSSKVPSICLWNGNVLSVKKEHLQLFDSLNKCGLICKDKQSVAKFVLERVTQGEWFDEQLEQVREEFCSNYAFTTPNYTEFNNAVLKTLVQ